jgi:UDPglucose--hexose-1-phosphate uridylyltransferase
MSELRLNPLLKTYTMVASNRQGRPNMPKDWCPFCPGENNDKVPKEFDVLMYKNDFPTLSITPPLPDPVSTNFYETAPSYGKCEVILYSSNHHATIPELSEGHILKLVNLWVERTEQIAKDPNINYIFIFENRGAEVGVTMPHPHGQIYGYSWLPLKLKVEMEACKEHYLKTGNNMILQINEEEKKQQSRVIYENASFICYIPFFTDYPYGIFIASKMQRNSFTDFSENEKKDLAQMLKYCIGALDSLFNKPSPYMMCVHQAPVNMKEYADCSLYYSFHIEFYPPLRAENTIKWYASSEMGAWAAANTRAVEETSVELREALHRFIQEKSQNE